MVQKICNDAKIKNEKVKTYFISPSLITGAIATKEAIKAENYSINKKDWKTLPSNISPVTGNLKNIAYALVIKDLEIIAKDTIDLWDYADYFEKNNPIKLIQGRSTVCACMKNMKDHPEKLKSNNRDLMEKCILCDPYCVWVK